MLGSVVGQYDHATCQTTGVGVRLSALGEKVLQCWQHIPKYHPSVQVIDAQVMPEHFHGLLHDYRLAQDKETLQQALADIQPKLLTDKQGQLALDYIGKRTLLSAPRKLPLVCHRADAQRFAEQSAAVMREAARGAVIVSAFVSKQEREILKQLLDDYYPVIEIRDNGFGRTYKPAGVSFYACAQERLLQITPWKYHYEKDPQPISRPMCMVMNELARLISGQPDDWWKR